MLYREHLQSLIPENCAYTIIILFYTDEIEVVNPLGAKRGTHKLLAVYCCLLNLHAKYRSKLQSIYMVMLVRYVHVATYGLATVLQPLLTDLNHLYDKGLTFYLNGVMTNAQVLLYGFCGGGCAPASQLTDELERVGAVASHMSTRVENPFDSDRGRHAVTPRSQSTPSVVTLLQPMQVETLEPPNDSIYEWDLPASPNDESSEVVCIQAQNGATTAEVELSAQGGPADLQPPVPPLASPLQATPQNPAPVQRRTLAKRAAVEEELSARLSSVEQDNKRKTREHLLKMKLMRAEHALHMRQSKQMHELDCASKKAKLELLMLKIDAVKKASK
ncbi:hypothetical protein HPB49_024435 [Dermacentor silvarum]|uniref:Uncharacterized protein n=1 Tax=Dermacentor silvarum TaxID=543639 RepID=A0ACB8DLH7_DERSI|nr:hypothetical protein HPB49_024435 [Dermacentor silvarum]